MGSTPIGIDHKENSLKAGYEKKQRKGKIILMCLLLSGGQPLTTSVPMGVRPIARFKYVPVAQLVEREIEDLRVSGSIPFGDTIS